MNINHPVKNKVNRKEMIILIVCFLIGFALRFYTFDQKSLWIDEVYTFNDSRIDLKGQIQYFKDNPADLIHPPLFFVLTHLFYPFEKPERDLRIIPLIFGVLSIPMIFFLTRLFSRRIALPCTISLAFMTYHISFSQDGRSYSLLMFLGMAGLYFFLRYLEKNRMRDLFLVAFFFAILFYTSYSSIPFIVFSQIFWFYQMSENSQKLRFSPFLILNAFTLLLCMPWIIFMGLNYKGQPDMDIVFREDIGSLWSIISGILNDWVPLLPLTVLSIILLILFPISSKHKKNALILLAVLILPVLSLYLFCRLFNIYHYFSSRYLINFLPLFLITIFLSLDTIETKFKTLSRTSSLKLLFIILFIASNMTILPLYYRSEKQDFRGLVSYLNGQLRDGDKVFVKSVAYIPGMLHYFRVYPQSRHYDIRLYWSDPVKKEIETKISLTGQNKKFAIYYSNAPFSKYVEDGSRLWIVAGEPAVKEIKESFPCVLKGYFDGNFCNFRRFPSDASMYLFLWDPLSPKEKGIDMPIE